MGVTIHGPYVEQQLRAAAEDLPWTFLAMLKFQRDGALFQLMTEGAVEPRGIPSNISYVTQSKYLFSVVDEAEAQGEACCSESEAKAWLESGDAEVWSRLPANDTHKEVILQISDPSAYNCSWLTTEEVAHVAQSYKRLKDERRANTTRYLRGLLAFMRAMERPEEPCRIVFWFDH